MPIIYDPTESRSRSRLPADVQAVGRAVPGLEALTGADLLVSLTEPPTDLSEIAADVSKARAISALRRQPLEYDPMKISIITGASLPFVHKVCVFLECSEFGLLAQRKTGRDLASSTPELSNILLRLLPWSNLPWLLFVGRLECSKDNKAVVDGFKTGWDYSCVIGAIESWQYSTDQADGRGYGAGGGFYTHLSSDDLVLPWLQVWERRLMKIHEPHYKPKRWARPVVGADGDDALSVLCGFYGLDVTKGRAILEHTGGLAAALSFLSNPESVKGDTKLKGIAAGTIKSVRQQLGLDDGQVLTITEKE